MGSILTRVMHRERPCRQLGRSPDYFSGPSNLEPRRVKRRTSGLAPRTIRAAVVLNVVHPAQTSRRFGGAEGMQRWMKPSARIVTMPLITGSSASFGTAKVSRN